jgi:hypothetical protein
LHLGASCLETGRVTIPQINMKFILCQNARIFALKICKKNNHVIYYTVQCIWFLLLNTGKSEFEWFNEFMMTMGNLTSLSVFSFICWRNPVYSINIYLYILYMSWQTYMSHNIRLYQPHLFRDTMQALCIIVCTQHWFSINRSSTITSKGSTCTGTCISLPIIFF